MKKAVFLDRDGVLCEDTDYITSFEKLHIFEFAKEAIKLIKDKRYLAIVISNQSAVARNMMTEMELKELNSYLIKELDLDAVYCCPHLPPESLEIKPYRISCSCRKPDIGMILHAKKEWDIDLEHSYMVGDRETDILAGIKANLKTVKILSNTVQRKFNVEADSQFKTVKEFALTLNE